MKKIKRAASMALSAALVMGTVLEGTTVDALAAGIAQWGQPADTGIWTRDYIAGHINPAYVKAVAQTPPEDWEEGHVLAEEEGNGLTMSYHYLTAHYTLYDRVFLQNGWSTDTLMHEHPEGFIADFQSPVNVYLSADETYYVAAIDPGRFHEQRWAVNVDFTDGGVAEPVNYNDTVQYDPATGLVYIPRSFYYDESGQEQARALATQLVVPFDVGTELTTPVRYSVESHAVDIVPAVLGDSDICISTVDRTVVPLLQPADVERVSLEQLHVYINDDALPLRLSEREARLEADGSLSFANSGVTTYTIRVVVEEPADTALAEAWSADSLVAYDGPLERLFNGHANAIGSTVVTGATMWGMPGVKLTQSGLKVGQLFTYKDKGYNVAGSTAFRNIQQTTFPYCAYSGIGQDAAFYNAAVQGKSLTELLQITPIVQYRDNATTNIMAGMTYDDFILIGALPQGTLVGGTATTNWTVDLRGSAGGIAGYNGYGGKNNLVAATCCNLTRGVAAAVDALAGNGPGGINGTDTTYYARCIAIQEASASMPGYSIWSFMTPNNNGQAFAGIYKFETSVSKKEVQYRFGAIKKDAATGKEYPKAVYAVVDAAEGIGGSALASLAKNVQNAKPATAQAAAQAVQQNNAKVRALTTSGSASPVYVGFPSLTIDGEAAAPTRTIYVKEVWVDGAYKVDPGYWILTVQTSEDGAAYSRIKKAEHRIFTSAGAVQDQLLEGLNLANFEMSDDAVYYRFGVTKREAARGEFLGGASFAIVENEADAKAHNATRALTILSPTEGTPWVYTGEQKNVNTATYYMFESVVPAHYKNVGKSYWEIHMTGAENSAGGAGSVIDRVVYHYADGRTKTLGTAPVKTEGGYYSKGSANPADKKTGAIIVYNDYQADGSTTLQAIKHFDKSLLGGEFVFEITNTKAPKGQALFESRVVKNQADGNVDFGQFYFEKDTQSGVDMTGEWTFEIKEKSGNATFVGYDASNYRVTMNVADQGDGTLAVTSSVEGQAYAPTTMEFINTYKAEGQIDIHAKKYADRPLREGQYTFDLTCTQAPDQALLKTWQATNTADGAVDFASIPVTKTGTYVFTLKEQPGQEAYMIYDDTVYTITVTVTDECTTYGDEHSGILTVRYAYAKGTEKVKNLEFYNHYQATGKTRLQALKTFEKELQGGEFTFVITNTKAPEGCAAFETREVSNAADGTVDFGYYIFDKNTITGVDMTGEWTFRVEEKAGKLTFVDYDADSYEVTITVKDSGDGHMTVKKTVAGTKLSKPVTYEPTTMEFQNHYKATGKTQLQAFKTFEKELQGGEFTFVITNTKTPEGCTAFAAREVSNAADGMVDFGYYVFTKSAKNGVDMTGEWVFHVEEKTGKTRWVDYDSNFYDVTITVKDAGDGRLTVKKTVAGSRLTKPVAYEPTTMNFINGYRAEGDIVIQAHKYAEQPLHAGQYTFDLTCTKAPEPAVVTSWQATNTAEGDVNFLPISVTTPGVYVFTLQERQGEEAYMIYDRTEYTITVTVKDDCVAYGDDNSGRLTVSYVYAKGKEKVKNLEFHNHYRASGRTKLQAMKTFAKKLNGGEFTFVITNTKAPEGQTPFEPREVTNAADGTVDFGYYLFEKNTRDGIDMTGEWVFHAEEKPGDVPWVVYDTRTYDVTVIVTDNGDGTLSVKRTVYDREYEPTTMAFQNEYHAQGSMDIVATKTYSGLLADDDFTFEMTLVKAPEGVEPTVFPTRRATNRKDGSISFGQMNFDESMVGTYIFQIEELDDGKSGVVYDAHRAELTVTVQDECEVYGDENFGTLTVQSTLEAEPIEFINTEVKGRIGIQKKGMAVVGTKPMETALGVTVQKLVCEERYLSGAEYAIYADEGLSQLVETLTTDADGPVYSEELALGTYYIKEVTAPTGYALDLNVHTVTLEAGNDRAPIVDIRCELTDRLLSTKLEIAKVEKEKKTPLSNVYFGVFAAEDIQNLYGETLLKADACVALIKTGAEGLATMTESLPAGKYYYRELKTQDASFVLDETKYEFTVAYDTATDVVLERTAENSKKEDRFGVLELQKTDQHGQRLKGAEFRLTNQTTGEVWTLTLPDGTATVGNLPVGYYDENGRYCYYVYELVETKGPEPVMVNGQWQNPVMDVTPRTFTFEGCSTVAVNETYEGQVLQSTTMINQILGIEDVSKMLGMGGLALTLLLWFMGMRKRRSSQAERTEE